jgi:hypothetical protein
VGVCLLVKGFWCEVDSTGPGHGPGFGIDGNPGEVRGVVEWFQDSWSVLSGEVHVAYRADAELQAE